MPQPKSKIGILVVAYNAASTLATVLDRIPEDFRHRITDIFVCDDFSQDATYLVGLGYKQLSNLPLTVIRHPKNLGYGGNQKAGYRLAIEHGLDVVVLLHGDGQYAPECIADLVDPLVRGEADAVFGSRMMNRGDARQGGMPLYKYVGNRVLTSFQNSVLGTDMTEFHSGYRAYSVAALSAVPFEENADGFNFDTQIILQLLDAGKRILEVPIPTYYGDEICYVNGLKYAKDVSIDVLSYRLGHMGFGGGVAGTSMQSEYALKGTDSSSHGQIAAWMSRMPSSRVLDLGCSGGHLAAELRKQGHRVTGVDTVEVPGVRDRVDEFVLADLSSGIPPSVGTGYDVVIAADVLEHIARPDKLLDELTGVLDKSGSVITSVPNFAHWYARVRTALGMFDYDDRGILDRGHLRFFTRRSFRKLIRRTGWTITRTEYTGVPVEVLQVDGPVSRGVRFLDRLLVTARPTLFAYQFLFQLHRRVEVESAVEAQPDRGGSRVAS